MSNARPNARAWLILALGFFVLAAGLAAWHWTRTTGQPVAYSGTPVTTGTAQVGGPFELIDQNGGSRTDRDFRGRYMLVSFGYTYCPDICPTTLLNMSQALRRLETDDAALAAKVVPIFVTIDPERDTVETLAAYAPSFHPALVALTGPPEHIAQVAKAYLVYYAKAPQESGEDYLLDHSSYIYLMGPDGAYVTHFSHLTGAGEIAENLTRYVR